jgi:hypothetical protein
MGSFTLNQGFLKKELPLAFIFLCTSLTLLSDKAWLLCTIED